MKPDDQDWLDSLAGRAPGADAEARQLGQALRRQAAQRAEQAVEPPTAESLMAAANALGLTETAGCRTCDWLRGLVRAPRRPLIALATAMALLLLLLPMRPPEPEAPMVLRGAADTQLLQDANPSARRERLARHLESTGVKVQRYEHLGRAGLYAHPNATQQAALAAWLKAEGLSLTADGELQIEVEAAR